MSPWPEGLGLESLVQPPDLRQHLARVEQEMELEHLTKTDQIQGRFADHSQFVILSYSGTDKIRGERTAVRVATGHGVILALGPEGPEDLPRPKRTHLAAAIVKGGGWRSGTDLNGDGHPDVAVVGADGTLELWYLMPKGASPYSVKMIAPPDHAVDVNEDGRPDLAAWITLGREDALKPQVLEVAVFESGEYRNDSAPVRAWHAQELRRLGVPTSDAAAEAATERSDRELVAEAIERAWHALRSGEPSARALERADSVAASKAPLAPGIAQSWVRWRGWLAGVAR